MKILSVFGHSEYYGNSEIESDIKKVMIDKIENEGFDTFYNGGKGHFDWKCVFIVNELKEKYNITSSLALAYPNPNWDEYDKRKIKQFFDEHFYPEFKQVPARFAILARNEWMIDNSDFIIFYVTHRWGGAYKALEYAKRKKKDFIIINEKS